MALVAIAHEEDLDSACHIVACVNHHPIEGLANHVNALLHGQPANKRDQSDVRVRLKADLLLQLQLALSLALDEGAGIVLHGKKWVRPWIPRGNIDPIEDA